MSANLTPEYEHAERQYREAATDEDRLAALREMLRAIPKHKGTEKMQADLKRRISQMRRSAGRKSASRGPDPFHVPPGGAGQVVLIGPPNTGKSSILAATTHAPVKVTDYPFSTPLPVPGMAHFEDAPIQLVDTPPLLADHMPPGLMGTVRGADVIGIVVDAAGYALEQADNSLEILAGRGVRLQSLPRDQIEHDEEDSVTYPGLLVVTKTDLAEEGTIETLRELLADRLEIYPISTATGEGVADLLRRLWEMLAMIRVYTKQPGEEADYEKPFTLPAGSNVDDLAREIHRDLPEHMKFARVWGEGRYAGQQVHRTEALHDKDVVEIHE